jgi:gas vesicle protein
MNLKNLLAFAGGIAVGAVAALLLAPTSGAELRGKIIELLKSKGISKEKFDELVALITARVKSFTNMNDLEIIVDEVLAEEGEVQQNAKL